MQWYKTATKNLETKISSNLESLKFQTCNDTKLQLPNLEIKIASTNTSALSKKIFIDKVDVFIDAIFISKFGNCCFVSCHV